MGIIISLFKKKAAATSEFEEVFRPHLNHLYGIAYRLTGNVADAEDLTQEVLLKVYPKYHGVNREKIRSWLATIAYRTFIDQKRHFKRTPFSLLASSDSRDDRDAIDKIETSTPGPEEIVEKRSSDKWFQKALSMLNEEQRLVIVLHDMEGYTLSELVSVCNAPLGTLKSRLHRARASLRKIFEDGAFLREISS